MKTYGVKILYRIEAGEDVFYEESVVRLYADSFEEALAKAEEYAQYECMDEYTNPYGETVRQSVINVMDCFEAFAEIGEEHEVYSRIVSGAEYTQEELEKMLFDRADCAQMMSLRVQEYNEPWTRREMRVLLHIFNREPVSLGELRHRLGDGVQKEIGGLLRKGMIEETRQEEDHGCILMYRTSAAFREEFAGEELTDEE